MPPLSRQSTWALRQASRLLPRAAGSPPPNLLRMCRRHIQTSAVVFSQPSSSSSPTGERPDPHLNTVNQTEVSHFDALASTWWDSHGPSRLLHLMNPLRHDFINTCHASEPPPPAGEPEPRRDGLHYLDVGCGGGIFAESAARLPSVASVTAIDASPQVLAVARAHLRREPPAVQRKLTYTHSSVEALSPAARRFDVVTTFEVLEHVDQPAAFLERCAALVRPGGWLVLSTMARTWTSWATTILAAERVLGIVPPGTHDWRKYVHPHELAAHFRARPAHEGWNGPDSIVRCQGVVYVPGLGWKYVPGSEKVGNYFFGVRKSPHVD